MTIKLIDLFAGIGGIRLGFEQAAKNSGLKTKTIFSCEIDEKAKQTYRSNFGTSENIFGDIKKLKNSEIKKTINDHDILLAGFPCPGFSIAGVVKRNSLNRQHGFADRKGNLFPDIVRILRIKKPKSFLLENVPYIRSHNEGKTFKKILKELDSIGYYVPTPEVLNSSDFGLPQKRRRIYIVGFRKFTLFNYPGVLKKKNDVASILEKNIDPKYFISKKLWISHKARNERNKIRGVGFGYGLVTPESSHTRTLSARYYKDGSEILLKVNGSKIPRKLTP